MFLDWLSIFKNWLRNYFKDIVLVVCILFVIFGNCYDNVVFFFFNSSVYNVIICVVMCDFCFVIR